MTKPIEMSFGLWTGWAKEPCITWMYIGANYIANAIEPFMCGGDGCGLFVTLLCPHVLLCWCAVRFYGYGE